MSLFEIGRINTDNLSFPYLSPIQIYAGCTGNDTLCGYIRPIHERSEILYYQKLRILPVEISTLGKCKVTES